MNRLEIPQFECDCGECNECIAKKHNLNIETSTHERRPIKPHLNNAEKTNKNDKKRAEIQ